MRRAFLATFLLALAACAPGADEPGPGDDGSSPGEPAPAVQEVASPAPVGAKAPELSLVAGRPALTWLERSGDGPADWRLRFARLGPEGWSEPVTVAPAPADRGAAAQFFANWADRPGVVQGGSQGGQAPDGPLYAWWLAQLGEGTYAYGIHLARSADGGATWEPLGLLHDDVSPTEHGFVTLLPEGAGVRAVWLDGRATARGGPMTLRSALVTDRVEHDGAEVVDASVCDCCNTAAVRTSAGPLVLYRGRTAEELRDIWAAQRTGDGWSEPVPVHRDGWEIAACPVNGPVVERHADGSGETVWAAWFTAAPAEAGGRGSQPRVLAALSQDGGRTFGAPLTVDADGPMGRLDLALDGARGEAVVSWLDATEDGQAAIRLRRIAGDGRLGPVFDLARSESSRASGVPRLLAYRSEEGGERLLAAWVEPEEDAFGSGAVRLASVPIEAVPPP